MNKGYEMVVSKKKKATPLGAALFFLPSCIPRQAYLATLRRMASAMPVSPVNTRTTEPGSGTGVTGGGGG